MREGNEYLDATAGLWFASVGHGRREIAQAVAAQLEKLAAHHIFGDHANEPALELADRLAALSPVPDAGVFLGSSGGEAVDTASKIVRRYWALRGQPQRTVIVSRSFAYHGTNAYGTSLSGIPAVRDGYGALVEDVAEVPFDDAAAVATMLDSLGDRAAAFIGEPMIGAGGALPPPDGYWPAVEQMCRERGVLLIADEVISGFGRLGAWFGCERYGFTPDLMTCAKGISSGYVPLGAVIVSGAVREPFWDPAAPPFLQGGTYAGIRARVSQVSRTSRSSSARGWWSASRSSSPSCAISSRRWRAWRGSATSAARASPRRSSSTGISSPPVRRSRSRSCSRPGGTGS